MAARKSQLFLHEFVPVKNTFDELVKGKLQRGKFPLTKTGIVKMLGMAILAAAIALFYSQSECAGTSQWYPYLFPICLGMQLLLQLVLFLVFSFGCTVQSPWPWIKLDIFSTLVLSIVTIVAASMTHEDCVRQKALNKIPGPLGIAAGIILIISCAALFLLYRYVEDDSQATEGTNVSNNPNQPSRKSIFA